MWIGLFALSVEFARGRVSAPYRRRGTEITMFESAGRGRSGRVAVDPGARARDTDAGIHAQQISRYRSMSPVRKLEIVFELSAAVDALLAAGIRQRQPQLDDAGVRAEMVRLKSGGTGS